MAGLNFICNFSSVNDLTEFIKVASSGLANPAVEGDYDGLVKV